jgi:hypothetical protein
MNFSKDVGFFFFGDAFEQRQGFPSLVERSSDERVPHYLHPKFPGLFSIIWEDPFF